MNLQIIDSAVRGCMSCSLCKKLPPGTQPVPGDGGNAKYMIIGEAPGENEILSGLPFVGAAGKMLDTLLNKASLKRADFYITNVVKCRPTDTGKKNRPPTKEEIAACKRHLWNEIKILAPEYIFTLGRVPTYLLLSSSLSKTFKMTEILGNRYVVSYTTAHIIPNLHPSYIMQYGKKWMDTASEIFRIAHEKK